MKIAHISDVHLRNLKMHDEYRAVFENLYQKLDELKPDLVINTGDSGHTKTQISPEFVEMESQHIRRVIEYAPYHIILGNHDLNLMNLTRQDAITPIVESINDSRIHLHKKSGPVLIPEHNLVLWVFSLADTENYPTPMQWSRYSDKINIGLFHGSISNCTTDSNWRMTNTEHDVDIFEGLDYVLMGDIHKQQFFNDRKIAYAGSLIQQNFGEDPEKGFLVWNVKSKTKHEIQSVFLQGNRKFYTLKLKDDLSIPPDQIAEDSRIRISPPRQLSLTEQKEIEKQVKRLYKPFDVITLSATNIGTQHTKIGRNKVEIENLRSISIQERLIRDYLKDKKVDARVLDKILDMNRRFQISVDQKDDVTRNISWRINKIGWSNIFNYGEDNIIDFSSLKGVTGIFAPNASGKSNLIDIMLETLFDTTTRAISKNIFLINDNKESATMVADLTSNDQNYVIERTIEKIKYGQRKFSEAKEWGKTSCNFSMVDSLGDQTPLVGDSRPETERSIRQRVGSYDDLLLTSIFAQWNPMDIIAHKETKRREILCKFLDLDIFEQKGLLGKEESKKFYSELKLHEDDHLEDSIAKFEVSLRGIRNEVESKQAEIEHQKNEISRLDEEIVAHATLKIATEKFSDPDTIRSKLMKLGHELLDINRDVEKLTLILSKEEKEISKIGNVEEDFDIPMHEKATQEWSRVGNEISLLERMIGEHQKQSQDAKKRSSLLKEVPCGDQFPQCKFLIDAFNSRVQIPKIEDEIIKMNIKMNEFISSQEQLLKLKERLDLYRFISSEKEKHEGLKSNLQLKIENLKLKANNMQSEIDLLNGEIEKSNKMIESIQKNKEIDAAITRARELKESADHDLSTLYEELSLMNKRLGSDDGKYQILKGQVEKYRELKETIDAYELYAEAMGKDGIAYRILAQKLPLINEEINKILSNAADFGVIIEDDPEEQSIRIYLQYGQYKPRLIELGSGAEKMLASIALRVALLNISNLPKTNMFILDEGFGKLDPKNLENVNRMFDYLRSVFDHILVISHLDLLKDMVDNTIEIVTDEAGYAHVEVIGVS